LPHSDMKVQECDATDDDNSNQAGYIKILQTSLVFENFTHRT